MYNQEMLLVKSKVEDMDDLEEKLKLQELADKKEPKRASVTRKFIVVEGIYANTGKICPLPKLVEMKYRYKVRLFVEESFSFGVLGEHGRGVTEHFNIPVEKVDLIAASLEYSLASIGGFCAGRTYVIDHQRLSGQGYVFSASLPPVLACGAIQAIDIMEEDPKKFTILRRNASYMQQALNAISRLEVEGYPESPTFHLRVKSVTDLEESKRFLQKVVDECLKKGVALTIAAKLEQEEKLKMVLPSIRVSVSSEMSEKELSSAANVIKSVVQNVEETGW